MKILLELRPALDGYAGIPQETRLLFKALSSVPGVEASGLLQSSNKLLSAGLPSTRPEWQPDREINALSRVVVSLAPGTEPKGWARLKPVIPLLSFQAAVLLRGLLGMSERLGHFDPRSFQDFIWRSLFSKTLGSEDFQSVTGSQCGYRVMRAPWVGLHMSALWTRRLGWNFYPRLDTSGIDLMIAETPYPGRVKAPTRLIVRYHDAIPLLMPHTISDRAFHRASHYHALRRNVEDGAWFACVSQATRTDLLSVFPHAEHRAVTIPNMISPLYHAEQGPAERVAEILKLRRQTELPGTGAARLAPSIDSPAEGGCPDYLLMVSTVEPRKNHLTLLSAWEALRSQNRPRLQLVFVGMLGWDHRNILRKLQPWLERGGVHMLHDVPAAELRLLYRHAKVTVCPSFGEGFDFSGVEAMRCGGVVAASDIPVHREIYAHAARYFNPYSAADLAQTVARLLEPAAQGERDALVQAGAEVSRQYLPERVALQWQTLFERMQSQT